MTGSPQLTPRLVEQVLAFRLRDVPPAVVADAKLVLLDTLGAAIQASSSAYPTTRILADFIRRCGGRPESSLVGQRDQRREHKMVSGDTEARGRLPATCSRALTAQPAAPQTPMALWA
jgi:hypothetical protein